MTLILGLLTLTLWVNTWTRIRNEQNRIVELSLLVVEDWLAGIQNQDWEIIEEKLNSSGLFTDWVIVDDKLNPVASRSPIENPYIYKEDKDLQEALRGTPPNLKGTKVSAPLNLPNGKTWAIKMDLWHLRLKEFNPIESLKIILWIMPLGTILLIIGIYILLTRLVIKPIEMLASASQRVARGDYTVSIPATVANDEVAHLINAYGSMLKEIKEYHTEMETKIEEARTKIKTTEEQLMIAQRLSATGTLAAGIAHEINNPLSGILNAAETLRKGSLSETKANEYLELIIDGLHRIQDTLKKILQFFPRKLVPQPIEIKPTIERALFLVQHRLETNKIAITNSVPNNLPRVFGEANELQQVFLNLLINALDAIMTYRQQHPDDLRGDIWISHETTSNDITIIIKDNGTGMSQPEVSRAFDLFYTTKEPGKGTGLGLAVVHNIIESHGGKITLESKRNTGTTIRILLPILKETIKSMLKGKYSA